MFYGSQERPDSCASIATNLNIRPHWLRSLSAAFKLEKTGVTCPTKTISAFSNPPPPPCGLDLPVQATPLLTKYSINFDYGVGMTRGPPGVPGMKAFP